MLMPPALDLLGIHAGVEEAMWRKRVLATRRAREHGVAHIGIPKSGFQQ
jgi:hypothetical protein